MSNLFGARGNNFLDNLEARALAENPSQSVQSEEDGAEESSLSESSEDDSDQAQNSQPAADRDVIEGSPIGEVSMTEVADVNGQAVPEPKKKRRRPRTPSPPVLPPTVLVKRNTIRLEFDIKSLPVSKGAHLVNVEQEARKLGFVWDVEVEEEYQSSNGSDDEGEEADKSGNAEDRPVVTGVSGPVEGSPAPVVRSRDPPTPDDRAKTSAEHPVEGDDEASKPPPKKRVRRVLDRDEGYDREDSFVDDSELALDMPKFYLRPLHEGYYVASGLLELFNPRAAKAKAALTSKVTKKKKVTSKDQHMSTPVSKFKAGEGSQLTPIVLEEDPLRPTIQVGTFDSTPVPEVVIGKEALSEVLRGEIDALKALANEVFKTHSKEDKKFPQELKEPVIETAIRALNLKEYGPNFFAAMKEVLIYNLFTTTKWIKKNVFETHLAMMKEDQSELIRQLQVAIDESMPEMQSLYEKALEKYAIDQRAWEVKMAEGEVAPVAPAREEVGGEGGMEVDAPVAGEAVPPLKSKAPVEPKKRFRFTDRMKEILHQIMQLDDDMVALIIEKMEYDKSNADRPSLIASHKTLYARLVTFWPEGWMSSTQISRENSVYKKKAEK